MLQFIYQKKGIWIMKKETITLDAVKQDFKKIVIYHQSNKEDWRFSYIVPSLLLSICLTVLFKSVIVSLVFLSIAVYHIVKFIPEYKELKAKKAAIMSIIDRGDISVSTEVLSHIATETIYEPHGHGKRTHATKTIRKYYFNSGSSWREPVVFNTNHYEWSRDFSFSPAGLDNISIAGDEFFYITVQEHYDIAYIYPCKYFELDRGLIK